MAVVPNGGWETQVVALVCTVTNLHSMCVTTDLNCALSYAL